MFWAIPMSEREYLNTFCWRLSMHITPFNPDMVFISCKQNPDELIWELLNYPKNHEVITIANTELSGSIPCCSWFSYRTALMKVKCNQPRFFIQPLNHKPFQINNRILCSTFGRWHTISYCHDFSLHQCLSRLFLSISILKLFIIW